jgi:DNA-binding NarL/FixJ family response regulator
MICLDDPSQSEPAVVAFAGRRRPPPLVIVDRDLRVIAQSFDLDISELIGHLRLLVERHLRQRNERERATIDVLDATTTLRIVDLAGDGGEYFAITFERAQQRRDAVDAVATEHRLTNRECEVFRLLLEGSSDHEVSQRLVIAKTTAHDHAQNILRKTGANKRAELFAKVMMYDERYASKVT